MALPGLFAAPRHPWAADNAGTTLTQEDCIKCHAGPPADVAAAGGKHRSE